MNVITAIEKIKDNFVGQGIKARIPLIKGGFFTAQIANDGVEVNNLGNQPFLPWVVFQEAVCVLLRNNGIAERGNAMNSRLGDPELSFNSVEGHIAHVVYGKNSGNSVFRRITPFSCILIWSGVCKAEPGKLLLIDHS